MTTPAVFRRMLNVFDPKRHLRGRELEQFYVERPHGPLESMKAYLRAAQQHVKVLFGGHRGSGKSTELARLGKDLTNDFLIVPISAHSLNISDLNYVDVMLASAAALFAKVSEDAQKIKIPGPVLREVLGWLSSEIAQDTTITTVKSGSVATKIAALVVSLQGKYATETTTRETVRTRLHRRLSDLIDQVNAVCDELEKVGPPPLIVFEDIDKADLKLTRELFFEHATTLNSLACRVIYTFPIPLRYANEFIDRKGDYNQLFLLPNVSLYHRSGQPHAAGRKTLRAAIIQRVQSNVFGKSALDQIVELSGGLMRDLVRIVADASLVALTEKSDKISSRTIRTVAAGMANEYRGVLLPSHYEALQQLRRTKQILPTEAVRDLLENLSLLEYKNDNVWCDVHPAVHPLLDSKESLS